MRLLALLVTALFMGQAYAYDMECVRQVNDVRTNFARIDTWPMMRVQTGHQDCRGGPGFKFCVTQNDAPIVDSNTVCNRQVDQRWDCETRDWYEGRTQVTETRCVRGITARLEISRSGQGRLICMRRGVVEKTVRLGECY